MYPSVVAYRHNQQNLLFKPLENEVMETYCPKDLNLNKNEANCGIKDNLRDS
jgi:hypothetical protein